MPWRRLATQLERSARVPERASYAIFSSSIGQVDGLAIVERRSTTWLWTSRRQASLRCVSSLRSKVWRRAPNPWAQLGTHSLSSGREVRVRGERNADGCGQSSHARACGGALQSPGGGHVAGTPLRQLVS